MASNVKSRSRREEVRRKRSEWHQSALKTLGRRYGITPLLLAIGLAVTATLVLLAGGQRLRYRLNQHVSSDVRARVDFEVLDEKVTEDKRNQARLQTPNVYVRNEAILASIRTKLTELFELAKTAENADRFIEAAAAKGWTVAAEDHAALRDQIGTDGRGGGYFAYMVTSLTDFLADTQYLVDTVDDPRRKDVPERSLLTWNKSHQRSVSTAELQYVSDAATVQRIAESAVQSRLPDVLAPLRPKVSQLIVQSLRPDPQKETFVPIYRYDQEATARLIEENVAAVADQINSYKAGEVLVKANTLILGKELALLDQEHKAYLGVIAEQRGELWREYVLRQVGVAAMAVLVVAGLAIYTAFYQPRIVEKPARALGLALLLLGMLALTRANAMILPTELATGPVVMAAMILAIVYDQRYALGIGGGLAILAALASEAGLGLFVTLLTALAISVFLLRDIRTRGKLIATGAAAALGAGIASAADGVIAGQALAQYVLPHACAAAGAALMAGFIVLGVLPVIESLFGVATSLTLLEWCDASRPLLQRLAQDAPGTHTHSLMIGTIAEKAADAIGANGLLARVGSLYHDIGKIAKPAYFVENQEAKINRHDRLGPTLSLLVIVAHVKDGLEMAKDYGLPRILHQFIAEHHGTTVVRYFQRVAAEQAQKSKTKELPESEFRYPGPKPRTRESAILMICDSVEGAVRALPEPTPGRIESTVHQVLMARLNDGQFDDCDITLKELSRVEDAVVKALCAAYHGRIAYPKDDVKPATEAASKREGEAKDQQEEDEGSELAATP